MILRNFTRNLLRIKSVSGVSKEPVKVAVCLDIEFTCDSPVQIEPMEPIEIACLKLDLSNPRDRGDCAQEDRFIANCPVFHSFVRPTLNSELTPFCNELTGILQSTVDGADPIDIVYGRLIDWLKVEALIDKEGNRTTEFTFATCGNADLRLIAPLLRDCYRDNNNQDLPIYFKQWMEVKKIFVNHKREWPRHLYRMLELLGKEPSGRLHSARDDCRNLARVVECLHRDGCEFFVTDKLK